MVKRNVFVSVVVPVWNGRALVRHACRQIVKVLSASFQQYEVIFVDDGSNDDSFEEIHAVAEEFICVHGIRLARNFGQHAALSAGLEEARGDVLVSFDVDLQCDPAEIPVLVDKVLEGYGVVSGWRVGREDSLSRRIPSYFMNKLINWYTGVRLHDHGCAFKAISREVADQIPEHGDLRRFLTALVVNLSPRILEVPVSHRRLQSGTSRYDFWRLFDLSVDFLTGYSRKPFRIVGIAGALLSFMGILGGFSCLVGRFFSPFFREPRLQGLIAILAFFGFQFLILWFIGEFSARTYQLLQHPPLYLVAERVQGRDKKMEGTC